MEYNRDNLFFRENFNLTRGHVTHGHKHNFSHVSDLKRGWFLIRGRLPEGDAVRQFATPEYLEVRRLKEKYEPDTIMRPIRFADTHVVVEEGIAAEYHLKVGSIRPDFNITFIKQGEPVPEGGTEILFNPFTLADPLIRAGTEHEIFVLSDLGDYVCVYGHKDAQGNPSEWPTGWEAAYA